MSNYTLGALLRKGIVNFTKGKIMNTNLLQTILTIMITFSGIVTTLLLNAGCTASSSGALDCAKANVPSWLTPYLIGITAVLGVVKLLIAAFDGKLVKPTAVISNSGAPGTVSPQAVQPK